MKKRRSPRQRALTRIKARVREVNAFLAAFACMGPARWSALLARFDRLGPANARKLHGAINGDRLALASWPEVDTIPTETAMRDAMRSHWGRNADANEGMRSTLGPKAAAALDTTADLMVDTIWFREYLDGTAEGRRAHATVAALFDGLLPDAAEVRRARARGAEQPRIANERPAESGRPAQRAAAETDHPVSPAYSALVTISERIDSGDRRRLTHGERLFVTLFDELNAQWENGGLEQYLTNSSGDRAEHARAYLAEVGAWKTLALLDEAAWRLFGGVIPRAGTARRARAEAVLTSDDAASAWLDAADRRWRVVQNELYDRLVRYAKSHAADFATGR